MPSPILDYATVNGRKHPAYLNPATRDPLAMVRYIGKRQGWKAFALNDGKEGHPLVSETRDYASALLVAARHAGKILRRKET